LRRWCVDTRPGSSDQQFPMSIPPIDEQLWFLHLNCTGRHFILGNPHTFRGRMMGWCPKKRGSFFFSKSEIEDCSSETAAWVKGYLSGNELSPPRNADNNLDVDSAEYRAWTVRMEAFRSSGFLPPNESDVE
jgi:hypothetical protein